MKSGILNINIRVERQDRVETNILLIYATIWTNLPNMRLKEFMKKDLINVKAAAPNELGILNLDLHLVDDGLETQIVEEPIPINCFLKLINGKNANFKFSADQNDIFVINARDSITGRPTGTKRTVITYEDTDIIDDTRF